MTLDDYNAFCRALPATSHVVQWGGAHVWKVGAKVFAIAWGDTGPASASPAITFKVSPLSFDMLKDQPGLRPAPYLASRGLTWIQHYAEPGLSDDELRQYLRNSHGIVGLGLSRKRQRELGLVDAGCGHSERRKTR